MPFASYTYKFGRKNLRIRLFHDDTEEVEAATLVERARAAANQFLSTGSGEFFQGRPFSWRDALSTMRRADWGRQGIDAIEFTSALPDSEIEIDPNENLKP